MKWKLSAFWNIFFGRVDKTAFYVSRIQRNILRRKNFFEKFVFHFRTSMGNLSASRKVVRSVFFCSLEQFDEEQFFRKCFLYSVLNWKVPWELSELKLVFIEKIVLFSLTSVIGRTFFGLLVVKFSTWLSKCHSNCSAVLSKLHSTLPNEQFGEKFFWRKIIFLSVSIFSTERSWPSVKKFPVDLPKLTSKYA